MLMVSPARNTIFWLRMTVSILPSSSRERFFKIMTMRRRPATGRNEHVDQAIAPVCIVAGEQDRVCVSDEAYVRQILIFVGRATTGFRWRSSGSIGEGAAK